MKSNVSHLSISVAAFFAAAVLGGSCRHAHGAELTVQLDNPPSTGTVVFLLFDSAESFADFREPAKTVTSPCDGRESYRLSDIPPGEYALLVYYDENGNGRLDKNFIGIPSEPLGFSNRYQPKGPPGYSRARFAIEEETDQHFNVELLRPLGKRGRIGIGVGAIVQSSPYRDSDATVFVVIPAITYIGNRLQILGPNVQVGLAGTGNLRLAATARYRPGAYEEDDSPVLEGMGNRDDTLMAGLALASELPGRIDASLRFEYDMLGTFGGGAAQLEVDKSFEWGVARISPGLAGRWRTSGLSDHDFGVPPKYATDVRSAYSAGDTFSIEVALMMFIELTPSWIAILNVGVEFLDDRITNSPIVSEDQIFSGFVAVNYSL